MKRRLISGPGQPERSAYDRGLSMLARREYSRRELRARLERAGCDEAESEAALGKLREQHYQDDARFGDMITRTRMGQGYGPARIRAELRSHGLADPEIRELIDAADADWDALAAAQLRKKYGDRPALDRVERGKRAAFLLRRGFSAATVRIVCHSDVD
ncbi:MAG TPA: regulatory protein RecX [Rhodanobacteraceae bacterium]|jgi:regulatory protein|nr:regulatory protein RecX [Rhodanobacteraceae bacterium]